MMTIIILFSFSCYFLFLCAQNSKERLKTKVENKLAEWLEVRLKVETVSYTHLTLPTNREV